VVVTKTFPWPIPAKELKHMSYWLTDPIFGKAFAGFTQEYASCDATGRTRYEADFEQSLGSHFLAMWRDWRRRHSA
jgi:hypothetical protein